MRHPFLILLFLLSLPPLVFAFIPESQRVRSFVMKNSQTGFGNNRAVGHSSFAQHRLFVASRV